MINAVEAKPGTRTLRAFARFTIRIAVRLLACLGLLVVIVTTTPLTEWWSRKLAGPWYDPKGDVLIVLSADMLGEKFIGRTSYWRCIYAVRSWERGGWRQMVISGGGNAAVEMAKFVEVYGVPAASVTLEPKSTSTRENAVYTERLLRSTPGKLVLLTSDLHMYRAHRAFQKAGLPVTPSPFPDGIKRSGFWSQRLEVFCDLVVESIKIGWYALHDWI